MTQKLLPTEAFHREALYTESLVRTEWQQNAQSTSQYYFVLPSTTWYYKLAQSTSQYYFVLQSLYKVLPSTTLYYKACTKHVPVLLCTSKLVQSTSQYYFVLQDMHKVLPSTTLYHKACTKHLPVLYMYIYHIISLVWSRNPFSSCVEGMEIKLPLGLGWYHADPSFTPPFIENLSASNV